MLFRILIFALVLFSHLAFSQVRNLIGRVVESGTEKPVRDANVLFGGATVLTNHLGYFELTIEHNKTGKLTISHITYKVISLPIPEQDRFKLYLEKDTIQLKSINLNLYPAEKPMAAEMQNDANPNETQAKFPGGIESFYHFMGNSLSPALPQLSGKGFRIIFTIDENGKANDWFVSDPSPNIQAALQETFQKMPAWIAATQQQKNVKQLFSISVGRYASSELKSEDLAYLYSYIKRTIKYPSQARRMGIEGNVYVQFSIDDSGNVLSTEVLQGISTECNAEAIRVITTAPREPLKILAERAHQHEFVLPIFYSLEDSRKKSVRSAPATHALILPAVDVMAGGLTVQRREVQSGVASTGPYDVPSNGILVTFNSLDEALKQPDAATRLTLRANQLGSFPNGILKLKYLNYLDLEQNQLPELPAEIGTLTSLKELYLLENKLTTLPDNFRNLKKLRTLGLAGNQLNSFPQPVIALEKLETLDLSYNQLTQIPAEIKLMKSLKVLLLMNNQIKNIPAEFYELKNLEKIYLQGNPIDPNDLSMLQKTFKKAEIGF